MGNVLLTKEAAKNEGMDDAPRSWDLELAQTYKHM